MDAEALLNQARTAAKMFAFKIPNVDVKPFGSGLINYTFLVSGSRRNDPQYILQCINRRVFAQPEAVTANLETVLAHVARQSGDNLPGRQLTFPATIRTHSGQSYFVDSQHEFWRAAEFVRGTVSYERVSNAYQARQIGFALGRFHRLLADLPIHLLNDPLPGFHIAPQYLSEYERVAHQSAFTSPAEAQCHEFITQRAMGISVLENERNQGTLHTRVIHGDPKVNNFLFSQQSGEVVSLIDLDTVKPGLVHYDLGDCMRSACNREGEDLGGEGTVIYDIEIASALLAGYLEEARAFMTERDFDLCYAAMRLIPLELGIRFFTDHLSGNKYFRVEDTKHNLRRACTQFRLVESIEAQSSELQALITRQRCA